MFHVFGYRGEWATSSGGNEGSRNACRKLRELQGTKMHISFHLTISSPFCRNTKYNLVKLEI